MLITSEIAFIAQLSTIENIKAAFCFALSLLMFNSSS
jgi:hypothetical protein